MKTKYSIVHKESLEVMHLHTVEDVPTATSAAEGAAKYSGWYWLVDNTTMRIVSEVYVSAKPRFYAGTFLDQNV